MRDHCVIGPSVNSSFGRTWMDDEDEAVAHAQRLLTNQIRTPGAKLFVVKVVKVVELDPPPTTVRKMKASDIAETVPQR